VKEEIYDYKQRLQRCRRIIKGLGNGELALSFLDHLSTLGLSEARVSAYAAHLLAILKVADFDLASASRKDIENVVAWINSQPYSESTKRDKKIVLKKFVQYAKCGNCDADTPYPKEVAWIKVNERKKNSRTTPEALLSREDFEALVKAADNARDKALVYTLFEGALRPGELLSMSVGSVEFKDRYCLITVNGKTGLKRLPLVAAYKPLLEWLEQHPRRGDLAAPLWCSMATNYKGERLSYRHFRLVIKRLAKKAGLSKTVWPYLFRHSTLTALAKVFTEARLEQYAGWVHGSKMSARYVHFSARDIEDAVLELHGMKAPGQVDVPRLVQCPRCKADNPLGTVYCSKCGYVIDKNIAAKKEEDERRKDELLLKLAGDVEQLKAVIASLISSQQAAGQQSLQVAQPSAAAPQEPSSAQQRVPQTSAPPERAECVSLKGGVLA
jgi:site-specific recombinase XerD/ribosomal protein L40E